MTLRKKLSAALGDVDVYVPPANPDAELIKGAEAVTSTVQALVDERNNLKARSEWLACQLEIAQQSIQRLTEEYNRGVARLGSEYDRTLGAIGGERDQWRSMLLTMVAANGELTATVNGLLSLGQNARRTLLHVEQLVAQLPDATTDVPVKPAELEIHAPTPEPDAPEPTSEDIERLRTTLTNLANVAG